jgi:excinuclease ABC subunit C
VGDGGSSDESFERPGSKGLPLDELARSLPELPGVYRFLDEAGRPVYVGKAKDLRKRVIQHLANRPEQKTRMLELAVDIDFTVTPNESAALLLERNLIRRFQPKFNVSYKDDKDYPYIVVSKDPFPRISLSRDKQPDGHTFGPFASAAYARQTIGFVRKHFQVRDCPEFIPGGCLSYHIKLCSAPCIDKVDQAAYGEQVRVALSFLKGERRYLVKELTQAMGVAAQRLDFERAARLRDTVRAIERTVAQDVDARGVKPSDADYFGVALEGLPSVFLIRERGRGVVDRRHFLLDNAQGAELAELLGEVIASYYETADVPREVFVPIELPDAEAIEKYLENIRGKPVRVHHPQRGHARRLVELAAENAAQTAKRELFKKERVLVTDLSKQLQQVCEGRRPVFRIEGFDISHTAGEEVVASMVVFENGLPKKAHYRKFKLKVDKNDDFGAMAEVVGRRYGGSQRKELPLPDLVLIDGGRGQLNWALKAGRDVGLELSAVGLAKKEEEIYLPSGRVLDLDESNPALKLLMRVRDEAHRFAITYHRQRRGEAFQRSGLESVQGVGPARARQIWKAFANLDELRGATAETIASKASLPPAVGRAVHRYLHPAEAEGDVRPPWSPPAG